MSSDSPTPLHSVRFRTPTWILPDDDRPDPDDPHQELLCELHPLLNSTPYGITLSGKVTLTVPMIDSLVAWLTKASDTAEFLNSNSRR